MSESSLNATQRQALSMLNAAKGPLSHRSGTQPTHPHHKTLTALANLGFAESGSAGYTITAAGKAALK